MSALAEALVAAQAELPCALGKDSTGQIQNRTYGYLSLDKLIEATKPILQRHGLTIVQFPGFIEKGDGTITSGLSTELRHVSGEVLSETTPLYVEPKTMQGLCCRHSRTPSTRTQSRPAARTTSSAPTESAMSGERGPSGTGGTAPRYSYPTEFVECDRCYGDGEVEDDLFVFARCYSCGGRGTVEVCAECYDSGEECDRCGC